SRGRSSCWMCARRRSIARVIFRVRVRFRSSSWNPSHLGCRSDARWSRTAGARIACTPTTRCGCCVHGVCARAGSTSAFPSGGGPGFRSSWRAEGHAMVLRQFLYAPGSWASYLFGCTTHDKLAVVDPHLELVDEYINAAEEIGSRITAVFETHVQADHVSGLPALVARTGATAYLPVGAGVEFEHVALDDGDTVELGNTVVTAIATPGHAPAHHAYALADRRRGT